VPVAAVLALLVPPSAASAGTITVNQFNDGYDDNGLCTLREAISAAQGNGQFNTLDCDAGSDDNHDTIRVPAGNTITLDRVGTDDTNSAGDLDIIGSAGGVDSSLAIEAFPAGGNAAQINQTGTGDRILQTVTSSVSQQISSLTLTNLVIKDGSLSGGSGGGVRLPGFTTATFNNVRVTNNSTGSAGTAGGLYSGGNLTLNDSRIDNNSAGFVGGAWIEGGTLNTIDQTTFDSNHATAGNAGGLAVGSNGPVVTVKNSTFANNDAVGSGGGISVSGEAPFTATLHASNVTIAGNTADLGEPGGTDDGGGIHQFGDAGTVNIRNSIVADNVDVSGGATDCSGTIVSQGYNLIESGAGCTFTNNNDLVGTDPKLNSLQGAGSPWTYWRMPLLSGSPAFNGGNPAAPTGISPTCETTDQEGFPRPSMAAGDVRCDMGAVEMNASDGDGDKHFTGLDNCPSVSNPDQADYEADGTGDACDGDDDNDSVLDGPDACELGTTGWTSGPGTDFDSDGCQDSGEDTDDDNDSVPDTTETGCPGGGFPTDTDSDDDTVLDAPDAFPCDNTETTDSDGDAVGDNADNCDAIANPGQQNNDGDPLGDACDPDDDNDGVPDASDGCPTQANATSTGCPAVPTTTTTSGPTGQRAAALKKCKKKRTAKAKRKCRRKANQLPL
jgi:CSLREA domain-containing protein